MQNKKKKCLIVFGTRPEAIKMAPVVHTLKKNNCFITRVCVTAQHREMLDQVLDYFNIEADYDLNLMKRKQTLNNLSSRILNQIDSVFEDFKPDLILVHGDTTTAMITSLAAFHKKIKIAHVEAGLRTHNKFFPYPEEINRQIISKITDFHFSPTKLSQKNLFDEGVSNKDTIITGNTVIDSLFYTVEKTKNLNNNLTNNIIKFIGSRFLITVTAHRRENFGEGIRNICESIKTLSQNYKDICFVFPVHLNPVIKDIVHEILGNIKGVLLIDPLSYENFIWLLTKSKILLTDSGGVQEEAPSLGVPVLLLRDETERPEGIESGTVKIVGNKKNQIIKTTSDLIENKKIYNKMSNAKNPYGDGQSSKRINNFLNENFKRI